MELRWQVPVRRFTHKAGGDLSTGTADSDTKDEPNDVLEEVKQSREFMPTPRVIDAVIAGVGLAIGHGVLALAEYATGLAWYTQPTMAVGIIFFAGARPPSIKAFMVGTVCGSTLSMVTIVAVAQLTNLPIVFANGLSAGIMLTCYKFMGGIFPPAAALPSLLAASVLEPGGTLLEAAHFLCFPWLAGSGALYAVATATSHVRSYVHNVLAHQALSSLGKLSDEDLREVFTKFDIDGSQHLDATELQVALRQFGFEASLEEAQDLVSRADVDGNGEIDFDEFVSICRSEVW